MQARNATIVIIIAALIGLGDAVLLTWDHQVHRIDPSAESNLCGEGEGCDIARTHPLSEIPLPGFLRPGIPISLLAVGAYLAFLSLAARRWRFRQERDAPRLLLALSLIACLYSCVLAFVSLMVQGTLCKLCSVLYAVNFVLLVASVVGLGESAVNWTLGVFKSALSKAGAIATVPMVAALIGGYAIYAPPVAEAYNARLQANIDQARKLHEAPEVDIDVTGRPGAGDEGAPVHIIEVADFSCSHCRLVFRQVHDYMEAHPGKVRMSFLNFPISSECNRAISKPLHPKACGLAVASECAHLQGKWKALARPLFDHGRKLETEGLVGLAKDAGLDTEAFAACMDDPATMTRVQRDIVLAGRAGVSGTPTYFINGRKVVGSRPQFIFEAMIEGIEESSR